MDVLRHFAIDILRLSLWLVVLSAVFIPLERLWALHPAKVFRPAVWTDIGYYFLNNLVLNLLLALLLATPAFHHWHHTNDAHANRNFSTMLPWMDRLFGTYHMPRGAWPDRYGIPESMPDGLGDQLVHPLLPRK